MSSKGSLLCKLCVAKLRVNPWVFYKLITIALFSEKEKKLQTIRKETFRLIYLFAVFGNTRNRFVYLQMRGKGWCLR